MRHRLPFWRHALAMPALMSLVVHGLGGLLVFHTIEPRLAGSSTRQDLDGAAHVMRVRWVSSIEPPPSDVAVRPSVLSDPAAIVPPSRGSLRDAASASTDERYYKLRDLDGPVLPVSAPDLGRLRRVVFSGASIRLRLWIGSTGQVERVDVVQAASDDADAVAQVQAMYYDTAFMPPLRQGVAVAARMDIEMDFTPESPPPSAVTLLGPVHALPGPSTPSSLR